MIARKKFRLRLPSRTLVLGERTLLMGVVNVTPDSFSGDGLHLDTKAAVARALEMERDGADIVDVGGESTRPGAEWLAADEELCRVIPVLNMLRGRLKIPISIDTNKSEVAEAAAEAGAEIINDVTALQRDPRIAEGQRVGGTDGTRGLRSRIGDRTTPQKSAGNSGRRSRRNAPSPGA